MRHGTATTIFATPQPVVAPVVNASNNGHGPTVADLKKAKLWIDADFAGDVSEAAKRLAQLPFADEPIVKRWTTIVDAYQELTTPAVPVVDPLAVDEPTTHEPTNDGMIKADGWQEAETAKPAEKKSRGKKAAAVA